MTNIKIQQNYHQMKAKNYIFLKTKNRFKKLMKKLIILMYKLLTIDLQDNSILTKILKKLK